MTRLGMIMGIVLGTVALFGCATTPQMQPGESATEWSVNRSMELLSQRQYDEALEMLSLAYNDFAKDNDEQSHIALHMAHALYLKGDYQKALKGYQHYLKHYPGAPKWERQRLKYEVSELSETLGYGITPSGDSLAQRHLWGDRELLKAQHRLEKNDFAAAYRHLDRAFQFLGDPSLLLESGLAASMAGLLKETKFQFTANMAYSGHLLSEGQLARLEDEITRVEQLLRGEVPDERLGYAECVYEKRGLPELHVSRSHDNDKRAKELPEFPCVTVR